MTRQAVVTGTHLSRCQAVVTGTHLSRCQAVVTGTHLSRCQAVVTGTHLSRCQAVVTGTHLSRSTIPRTCNNSTLLFPTAHPIPNTQWYKVKHSILPPIDMLLLLWLLKDVQILHCHSNFPSQYLFPLRRQTLLPKFQCYFFYKVLASTIVTQTRKAVASRSNKKGVSLLVAFRFQQIWGTLRGTTLGKCKKKTLQKFLSVTVIPVLFIEI